VNLNPISVPGGVRLLLFVLGATRSVWAQQPLTLGQALARADSGAFANRAAAAGADLGRAERDRTLRGLLPGIRAEAGWMRTTDPLNAFGFTLRQRAVSPESFRPDALNYPQPVSNVGAGLVAELPLLNPDVWLGRSAANSSAEAAEASARWTRDGTRLDVVRAYYGGVLAVQQVNALEAGLRAARSHVEQASALFNRGVVTRSDVLLAEVGAGEMETRLLGARNDAALAVRRLALALGTPADTTLELPATLPDPARLGPLASDTLGSLRADVEAASLGREAARRDVKRASALLLPRVNSFGRWDWNDPDTPFGGKPSWTVGVMATWSLFSGAGELVERRTASARAAAATAQAEAVEGSARLELVARRGELDVALASLPIAERAVGQAAEAHRIVARKYEGGLASVTELLDASALETRTQVEQAAAVYRAIVATGGWRLAAGLDLSELTALDAP
jgi:outer membrane protein TolC